MLLRLSKSLLVLTLMVSIGGHWALLQSVAWTTMFAANLSANDSLTEAVSKTFDGEHPCPLCCAIKAGKKTEKKSEAAAPELKKFEYVNESPRFVFAAPTAFTLLGSPAEFPASFSFTPPVPPPRTA
jgi:hypothetical protein